MIFKKKIYFYFFKLITFFLNLSVNFFLKKNKSKIKNFFLCTLDVNTLGDSILFIDYLRLKSFKTKRSTLLILPNLKVQITLANFFLKKKQFIVYDQFIYEFLIWIFNKYYKLFKKKHGSFLIELNFYLNQILKKKIKDEKLKYFNEVSFYQPCNLNKKILFTKYKKKFSKQFLKKYIYVRENDNKSQTAFKHIKLLKQNGYVDIKRKIKTSYKKKLFKKLNIKKKYICFYIRPHENLKTYKHTSYEIDPRSTSSNDNYFKLINEYFMKYKYQVVLMGSYNKAFEKIHSSDEIINYRNSEHQSLYNDFVLIHNSKYCISDPGGLNILPSILNKPNLVINSSCFYDNYYWNKTIYVPKNFVKNNKNMKYKEILKSPVFFENGTSAFQLNKIKTKDIEYEQLLKATKYFEKMIKKKNFKNYHSAYKEIKKNLSSLHLLANTSYKNYSKAFLESKAFD